MTDIRSRIEKNVFLRRESRASRSWTDSSAQKPVLFQETNENPQKGYPCSQLKSDRVINKLYLVGPVKSFISLRNDDSQTIVQNCHPLARFFQNSHPKDIDR